MSDPCTPRIPAALAAPSLNRGVGFTHEERRRLGLTGRLPSAVLTLDQQADRVWHQLQSLATDLGSNLLLEQLHYRHELLYFKVLEEGPPGCHADSRAGESTRGLPVPSARGGGLRTRSLQGDHKRSAGPSTDVTVF
jgi:hypothetical protein